MNQNNAAQPTLTDDEIRTIQGQHLNTVGTRAQAVSSAIAAGRAIERAVLDKLRQGGETVAGTPVDGEAQRPATISFVNGAAAPCGCTIRFSDGGGEYSDVHYVTLCGTHSGAALLSKVIKTGELTRPQHEDLEGEICAALAAPQASADAQPVEGGGGAASKPAKTRTSIGSDRGAAEGDVVLPSLPSPYDARGEYIGYARRDVEAYARAAVLADRHQRTEAKR